MKLVYLKWGLREAMMQNNKGGHLKANVKKIIDGQRDNKIMQNVDHDWPKDKKHGRCINTPDHVKKNWLSFYGAINWWVSGWAFLSCITWKRSQKTKNRRLRNVIDLSLIWDLVLASLLEHFLIIVHTFSTSMFALIFECCFDGKWLPKWTVV